MLSQFLVHQHQVCTCHTLFSCIWTCQTFSAILLGVYDALEQKARDCRCLSSMAGFLMQGKNDEVTYVFEPACQLGAKLAGVHWWFKSRAHAAELTAGYYNTRERDGYIPLMDILKKYHTHLSFTCVEMRDCEHPPEGRCSPQGQPPILASPFSPVSWLRPN